MSREILQRLLNTPDPVRRFCTIETVLPDGRYRVIDDQERIFTVDGDAGYLPPNKIIVQNGRITGFGARKPITKTVRV